MGYVLVAVMVVFIFFCVWQRYLEDQRQKVVEEMAANSNLTLQYVTLLHEFGVDSDEAHEMKLGHSDNATFLRRAQVLDEVFREKNRVVDKVDRMWEGK